MVNTMPFTNSETDEEIKLYCEKILSFVDYNKNAKIAFDVISEGIIFNTTSVCQKIIRSLVEEYNFNPNNIAIVYGAYPCVENINYYIRHCERFDWIKVRAIFFNQWESHSAGLLNSNDSPYHNIDNTPKIKSKRYLSYNRNVKVHRLYITSEIIKRGLLEKGMLSNYFNFEQHKFCFGSIHENLPNKTDDLIQSLTNHKDLFPIDLGLKTVLNVDTDRFMSLQLSDLHHFNETCFGIITETKYFQDNYEFPNRIKTDLSLDCYFFSEKTYKFIAAKKPFLLAGVPGCLELLKRAGYRTFHPYINESYDNVKDDELRLDMIVDEVERLCNMSDEEMLAWQHQVLDIVNHNYNVLKNSMKIHTTFEVS
jgi:hypothetical protein